MNINVKTYGVKNAVEWRKRSNQLCMCLTCRDFIVEKIITVNCLPCIMDKVMLMMNNP